MKEITFLAMIFVLLGGVSFVYAEQISLHRIKYGISEWSEDGKGNHRAVVRVNVESDAVRVRIPWRRRDHNVDKKDILVFESSTGNQITNVAKIELNRFYGDIAFQPKAGKDTYQIYYLPYNPGRGNFDDAGTYFQPQDTAEADWMIRNNLSADLISSKKWLTLPEAEIVEIQSRGVFNSFYPMEVVATQEEVDFLMENNTSDDYLLFTEDRKYPIRMLDEIPLKWIDDGPNDVFSGSARPGEYYVFQLGLFAAYKSVNNINLSNTGFRNTSGDVITPANITCLNLEGIDWLGRPFKKVVNVQKGYVQPLWVGVQIPKTAAGKYTSTLTLSSNGIASRKIKVTIDVGGVVLDDAGDSELWRLSRLRWLNSNIGVDDEVIPPFTPLTKNKNGIFMMGRNITFDTTGLPSSIVSSGREILAAPVNFVIKESGQNTAVKFSKQKVASSKPGAIEEVYVSTASKLNLEIYNKTEADGTVTCEATIRAKENLNLDDVRLQIPIQKSVAEYIMGFGVRGGYRRADINWKWDVDRQNNMVWIGDVDAGIQVKLCPQEDFWDISFRANGIPESWNNDGKGGCDVIEIGETVMVDAYTGARILSAGDELRLRYRFMITPFKPINPKHWNWRYGSVENGGNIFHLHHGNTENPYINYPFLTSDLIENIYKEIQGDGKRKIDFGSLCYPAKGNINQERGSLHAWVEVNFDAAVVAPQQPKYNRAFFDLLYKDNSSFSVYWNIDDHGMRAYVRDITANPMVLPSSSPEWKKGSKALITLSWGDRVQIFIDGKLKASAPWPGTIKRPIEDGIIKFSDGFILKAIKITDKPYIEGDPIEPIIDEHTLLLDTFSNWSGDTTNPNKIVEGTGKVEGVVKQLVGQHGNSMEFSYREEDTDHIGFNLYYTVRELSNHAYEMWPLRSLGAEIFQGTETFIYSVEKTMFGKAGGGYPWLQEHLVDGYVPAWRQPLPDGETDAAIGTVGLSRWHNYYVQGMEWLMKNTGVDGLYLDGIGYDREIMKRIAKTMYRTNPDSRINFHSGNEYDFMDMRLNPLNKYMEHLPYISNLWIGEMFDYNRGPDYWLVEISGLPFGITSEMLNYEDGGNAYRGMLYGMTGRMHISAPAMWNFWDEFGIQESEMLGYWNPNCPVKTNQPEVLATVYKKEGKSLISLAHWFADTKVESFATAQFVSNLPIQDGKIVPDDWNGAAKLSGFNVVGQRMPAKEQTEVWITSDRQNLYVAFRCYTAGAKPKANIVKKDGELWTDDSVELFIQPDVAESTYYQFIGNSAGVFFDGKGMDDSWNGDWKFMTNVEDGYWDGILIVPLKSFGLENISERHKIGFNACRNHQTPKSYGSSWAKVSTSYHDLSSFGTVEFSSIKNATKENLLTTEKVEELSVPLPTRLIIDWKALGIDSKNAKVTAPAIAGFQEQAAFSVTDSIPVEQTKGWLLIVHE